MKKALSCLLAIGMVLGTLMLPAGAGAFVLTATDFEGALAYDVDGMAAEALGLGTPFTGMGYNSAATVDFAFTYDPTYPSLNDVTANPLVDWAWTLSVTNFVDPWFGNSIDAWTLQTTASYTDLLHMGETAWTIFDMHFPTDGVWFLDYTLLTATEGVATLTLAATIDYGCLTRYLPDQWSSDFESGAEVTISAEAIPEPLTLVLFGTGLAGVALIRRRKTQ